MSRTDAHQPLWVSLARRDLAASAVHDHRRGECDLPDLRDLERASFERRARGRQRCHWQWVFDGRGVCACPLCSGAAWRSIDRRAARHRARDVLHVGLRAWHGGDASAFDQACF